MNSMFWLVPGGKHTNGGSASWSPGFSDRTVPLHRRPVGLAYKPEVEEHTHTHTLISPSLVSKPVLFGINYIFPLRYIWILAIRQQMAVPRFRERADFTRSWYFTSPPPLTARYTNWDWHLRFRTLWKCIFLFIILAGQVYKITWC